MNFLLEVTDYTKPVEGFLDRLTFGGFILLLGMAIVFSVLLTIWGALSVFKLYFTKNETKPKAVIEAPAAPVVVDAGPQESEIVAVIAAAIAAAEAESNGTKFKVVSFRRK